LRTSLFRIFQESLTNVARHAQATYIQTWLRQEDNLLVLTIQDNGVGIREGELKNPRCFGLQSLRERARQWRGETIIGGVVGKGTTITVCIPLPASPLNGEES
jgi:signal transduction histidine kinase